MSPTGGVPGTGDAMSVVISDVESVVVNESSSEPAPHRPRRSAAFFGAFFENKVALASLAVIVLVVLFSRRGIWGLFRNA